MLDRCQSTGHLVPMVNSKGALASSAGARNQASRDDVTVLIPAAGRVPEGLLALSNIVCPAMIPVAGRPVIHWTLTYLRSLGLRRFVVAVSRRGMFVEDFVDAAFGQDCEIRFMVPSRDGGVGQTVLELAELVETPAALVVLGDTHFKFQDPLLLDSASPFVLTSPVEESYRWCVAESTPNGMLARLRDKEEGLTTPLDALIGVYGFPNAPLLTEVAREAVARSLEGEGPNASRRTELSQIIEGVNSRTPVRLVSARDWLDVGNPDRQAQAHQSLLQARAFNELEIDATMGTITKRSSNSEKFIDEINYLRLLPPELAVLFPRVLGFSTEWQDPWIKLEFYGYPSLSEVFLFENVDPGIWERIFQHLHAIVRDGFGSVRRPLTAGATYEMAIGKTQRRLATMVASPELTALVQHPGNVTVNGVTMANFPMLLPRIEAAVRDLERSAHGTIVHGDLCLSNILYDLRARICKLIDPRGSFGAVGIYGDPRYDVAKLYHSVHGLYDFIVNDLFRVSMHGTHVELHIRAGTGHRAVEERFERVFFTHFDQREILLLSALLFASMPALHYDHPQRQLAMYVRSLQLLHEYFEGVA
jgi:dTDP-glucose pyrophosphorylase